VPPDPTTAAPSPAAVHSGGLIDRAATALRFLLGEEGDTYVLALVRIGFGLLLLNEAWLAWKQLEGPGFFGGYFHQPFLPESLVVSEGAYAVVIAAQAMAAVTVIAGRGARVGLVVGASLLVYTMLCDRLGFHHYRHTMAAFSVLLSLTPCDRHLCLGKKAKGGAGPLWAANAMKAQVSVMYLASGGSKLFDADWREGLMMRGMVAGFARLVHSRGIPSEWIAALETPLGASLLAKGAITTELTLAIVLWWPQARRLALWVGLFFHLYISLMTPVQLFTAEMLLVYLLFATTDRGARVLKYDPTRDHVASIVETLDWLARYRLEPVKGAELTVVDRGGAERRGVSAAACIFGTIPLLFPAWPIFAAIERANRWRAGIA
jgi:hypothetical protein